MNNQLELFECLICHSFCENLLTAQNHLKIHQLKNIEEPLSTTEVADYQSSKDQSQEALPIRKLIIKPCSVVVIRNHHYYPTKKGYTQDEDVLPSLDYYGPADTMSTPQDSSPQPSAETSPSIPTISPQDVVVRRQHRQSRLKADEKLRAVTAILRRHEKSQEDWSDGDEETMSTGSVDGEKMPILSEKQKNQGYKWEYSSRVKRVKRDHYKKLVKRAATTMARRKDDGGGLPDSEGGHVGTNQYSLQECKICPQKFFFSVKGLASHNGKCHGGGGAATGSSEDKNDTANPAAEGNDQTKETCVGEGRYSLFKCKFCPKNISPFSSLRGLITHIDKSHPHRSLAIRSLMKLEKRQAPVVRKPKRKLHAVKAPTHKFPEQGQRQPKPKIKVVKHKQKSGFTCDFHNCNAKFNTNLDLRTHQIRHGHKNIIADLPTPLDDHPKTIRVYGPRRKAVLADSSTKDNQAGSTLVDDKLNDSPVSPLPEGQTIINVHENSPKPPTGPAPSPPRAKSKSPAPQLHIKMEVPKISEEIHLLDKVLLQPDGQAVHMMGEQLSPVKTDAPPEPPAPAPAQLPSTKEFEPKIFHTISANQPPPAELEIIFEKKSPPVPNRYLNLHTLTTAPPQRATSSTQNLPEKLPEPPKAAAAKVISAKITDNLTCKFCRRKFTSNIFMNNHIVRIHAERGRPPRSVPGPFQRPLTSIPSLATRPFLPRTGAKPVATVPNPLIGICIEEEDDVALMAFVKQVNPRLLSSQSVQTLKETLVSTANTILDDIESPKSAKVTAVVPPMPMDADEKMLTKEDEADKD